MAGLPKDPNMLLSILNMKLRDFYPSLDALCDDMEEDKAALLEKLAAAGYRYDAERNAFVRAQGAPMSIETHMRELRAWLESQRDVPLEDMSGFFERRLEGYDRHMLEGWAESYLALAERVPADARDALDLGCGTGLELEAIWRRLPTLRVTGVDLTRAMLDGLAAKFPGKPFTAVCGDYFTAELGEAAYDVVFTFESLHHFPAEKKLPLYRKLRRALRPGGLFLYGDYFACCEEEERLLAETCRERRARANVPEAAFIHFDTPLTVEKELFLLREAGFALREDWRQNLSTHILTLTAEGD